MEVERVLRERGGVASRAQLVQACGRMDVDRAVRSGSIVVRARGRYALAVVDDAAALAHEMSGVLCLTSAALHHGWEVKQPPPKPHIIVPRKRVVSPGRQRRAVMHWGDLSPRQIDGIATSKEHTLQACCRHLPFDEALCIADSALRHGDASPGLMWSLGGTVGGRGARQLRRVADEADAEAANAFESTLRAIALDVPGLRVTPQAKIRGQRVWAQPDLVDRDLKIVLEAESFTWHADRAGFAKDIHRYTRLTAEGWLVLRFTWKQVMFEADEVREIIRATVAHVTKQALCSNCGLGAA